jgi:hypothetical protein
MHTQTSFSTYIVLSQYRKIQESHQMQYTCELHWAGNMNPLPMYIIFFVAYQMTFPVACFIGEELFTFSENSFDALLFP